MGCHYATRKEQGIRSKSLLGMEEVLATYYYYLNQKTHSASPPEPPSECSVNAVLTCNCSISVLTISIICILQTNANHYVFVFSHKKVTLINVWVLLALKRQI